MRVLQVIASVSRVHGGPAAAIQTFARALARAGVDVTVATTNDNGAATFAVPCGRLVDHEGMPTVFFERVLRPYTVAPGLSGWVSRHVADFDFVHCHGLFTHAPVAAALAARNAGVPYAVRTQGTLNNWGLTQRRPLFKRISRWLREDALLRDAAFVHVTSELEAAELAETLALSNVENVPIGFEFDAATDIDGADFAAKHRGGPVLYLGRLHPIKRIELLIDAFAELTARRPGRELVIAGSGDPDYVTTLKQRAAALGTGAAIRWPGFVEGSAKQTLLESAAVLVLPSDSENFGVSVVEAMRAGTPQVVRPGVALAAAVRDFGTGRIAGDTPTSLATEIDAILADADLARAMAAASHRAMRERFSEARMAERLLELYRRGGRDTNHRLRKTEA